MLANNIYLFIYWNSWIGHFGCVFRGLHTIMHVYMHIDKTYNIAMVVLHHTKKKLQQIQHSFTTSQHMNTLPIETQQ